MSTDSSVDSGAPSHDNAGFRVEPLPGAGFGGRVFFDDGADLQRALERLEAAPDALPDVLHACNGLLVLNDLTGIRDDPHLLLRLSRLFGSEVENYRETQAPASKIH
jgi:taurine dioxygenase